MIIATPRIPQGGRFPQLKADLRQLAEGQQTLSLQPGIGTYVIQTPLGTIVRAKPGVEEAPESTGATWLP